MTELRREIKWEPGYDHRGDPEKSQHGCHGLQIRWLVHGPKGSVQFLLMTGWLPTWEHGYREPPLPVLPADLGHHADTPHYDGQEPMECEFRPSGKCYYDGSSLSAERAFKTLVQDGEEAVWKQLEDYYARTFDLVEAHP